MNGSKFDISRIFWGVAHRAPSQDPSQFFSGFAALGSDMKADQPHQCIHSTCWQIGVFFVNTNNCMLQSGSVSSAFPQLAGMDMDKDGRISVLDFFRFNFHFCSVNTSNRADMSVVYKCGSKCWGNRYVLITDNDLRCLLTEFANNGIEIKDLTHYPTLKKMDTNNDGVVVFEEFMSFVNKTGFVNNIATSIGKQRKYNATMVESLKNQYYNLVVGTVNTCGIASWSLGSLMFPWQFDCIKKSIRGCWEIRKFQPAVSLNINI